jgi:hypothetical protein
MQLSTAEAIAWLRRPDPTLIIVGAGLSVSSPTCAPGVGPFLERTTELLQEAAGYQPRDSTYIKRLFPEVTYGAIGEVFGTDSHMRMWEVFSEAFAAQAGASPNVGHLVVADLAARNRWPVLTTNFDRFIERAAQSLGYGLNSSVPRLRESKRSYRQTQGVVTLVKVHGTADDHHTIRSTAADLSRCARIVQRLAFQPEPTRLLVIGYSGRDFDVFPHLAKQFANEEVLWVDVSFPSDHRVWSLPIAARFEGSWNDLAGELMTEPSVPQLDEERQAILRQTYQEAVGRAVAEHVEPLLRKPGGGALAALTGLLSATGAHEDVSALVGRYREAHARAVRFQMLLWGAHALASVDRYSSAMRLAREGRKEALRGLSPYNWGRSAIAITYSRTAAAWLTVGYEPNPSLGDRVVRARPVLAVLWVTMAYAPLATIAISRLRAAAGLPNIAEYRFASDYLEHLIRVMALLERLRRRLPGSAPLLNRLWARIRAGCESIGYTWGVTNTSKYLSRENRDFEGPSGAVTQAVVMGDLVSLTIALRDAGKQCAEEAAAHPTGPRRDQLLTQARELLDKGLQSAELLRNPTLELKIRLLRRQVGIDGPYPAAFVEQLIERAEECRAVQRQRQALLKMLTV